MTDYAKGDLLKTHDGRIGRFVEDWYDSKAVALEFGPSGKPQVFPVDWVSRPTAEDIAKMNEWAASVTAAHQEQNGGK